MEYKDKLNIAKVVEQSILENFNDEKPLTQELYANLIQDILEKRRILWQEEIIPVFKKTNGTIDNLVEVQSDLLSYRQMLVEEVGFINAFIVKDMSKIKKKKRDKYIYYSTGSLPDGVKVAPSILRRDQIIIGLKTTKGEKDLIISGDLNEQERVIEALEGYQGFLRECIKTVDHALYGIKNKIELYKIKLNIE